MYLHCIGSHTYYIQSSIYTHLLQQVYTAIDLLYGAIVWPIVSTFVSSYLPLCKYYCLSIACAYTILIAIASTCGILCSWSVQAGTLIYNGLYCKIFVAIGSATVLLSA